MSDQTPPPEVAIIGAGLAGLSAALALQLSKDAEHPAHWCVKRWPHGLPCGGSAKSYHQISHRPPIYLAGDRFSEWPSMSGALESGRRAAESLAQAVRAAPNPRV